MTTWNIISSSVTPLNLRVAGNSTPFRRRKKQVKKYAKYTGGQTEALMNMVGGEPVIDALLAGKGQLSYTGEAPVRSRDERAEAAFSDSYKTALTLRNFFRGWGKYDNHDGQQFSLKVSHLADLASNCGTNAITKNQPVHPDRLEELRAGLEIVCQKLAVFVALEGIELNLNGLNLIRQGVRENNVVLLVAGGYSLSAYLAGAAWVNDALMAPANKISGQP